MPMTGAPATKAHAFSPCGSRFLGLTTPWDYTLAALGLERAKARPYNFAFVPRDRLKYAPTTGLAAA
jgi:hypothetical protein